MRHPSSPRPSGSRLRPDRSQAGFLARLMGHVLMGHVLACAVLATGGFVAPAAAETGDNFFRNMMKTGPKASAAWCQREAMQRVAQAGAHATAAEVSAGLPERCDPRYAAQLFSCARGPAQSRLRGQERLRACMQQLAGDGLKAAR